MNQKNAFRAGLFMIFCVLLGVGLLIAIRGTGSFLSPMRTVTASFQLTENLGGLKAGDPVRIGGFDQGRVTAIRFVADGNPHLEAEFTLPEHYQLRRNTMVQVEQGLTGTANLNITALGNGPALAEGEKLDGQPSALTEFYAVAPEVRGLVSEIRGKIEPAYEQYASTVKNADQTMTTARATLDTAREGLVHVRDILGESKIDLRSAIGNFSSTTTTLKERLPTIFDRTEKFLTTTTDAIERTRGTLDDIRAAASNTKDATAEARSLLMRNRSRIDQMISSLRETSVNLEGASAEIRRNPWRLLYQPKTEELANLNLYDTTRQFALAANSLSDAASAVRDAGNDPTLAGEPMEKLLTKLNESFEKYKAVETKLWNAVK